MVNASGFYRFEVLRSRHNVDQRFRDDEASARLDIPDRMDRCNGGAHQLRLHTCAISLHTWIHSAHTAACPGPIRHFVYGTVEGHVRGFILNHSSDSASESCK